MIDSDYIATYDEYQDLVEAWTSAGRKFVTYPTSSGSVVLRDSTEIVEISIAFEGDTNHRLLKRARKERRSIATPSELLMLKLSHRYLRNSPHFLKTMNDIHLLRELGVELDDKLRKILKKRERETYTYAHPALDQSKGEFFADDGIKYVYDHDTIHEAVAMTDRPAYTRFMPVGSEVKPSKEMFFAQSYEHKLHAGLEESYVLALERSLIPHPGRKTPQQAFDHALMKVCTSITSGWFREFCWENYHAIRSLYSDDYVTKFEQALEAGRILPFK